MKASLSCRYLFTKTFLPRSLSSSLLGCTPRSAFGTNDHDIQRGMHTKLAAILNESDPDLLRQRDFLEKRVEKRTGKPFRYRMMDLEDEEERAIVSNLYWESRKAEPILTLLDVPDDIKATFVRGRYQSYLDCGLVLIGETYEKDRDEWVIMNSYGIEDIGLKKALGVETPWGSLCEGFRIEQEIYDALHAKAAKEDLPEESPEIRKFWAGGALWTSSEYRKTGAGFSVLYYGKCLSYRLGAKFHYGESSSDLSTMMYERTEGCKTLSRYNPGEVIYKGKPALPNYDRDHICLFRFNPPEMVKKVESLIKESQA